MVGSVVAPVAIICSTTIAVKIFSCCPKDIVEFSFFREMARLQKNNLVSRNVLRSAARHFPNLKSNVNALCQKKCTQQKKQQNRRRFLKARVIQRLPFRGGIFFHGNGTGIFLLLFNMIFV